MTPYCALQETSGRHAASSHCDASPPSLRHALVQLVARADELAAGGPAQLGRQAVTRYVEALDRAIGRCLAQRAHGCWLDVLCPLKENLQPLCDDADSVRPARVDPVLVTAVVTLTHLALALERRPTEVLVCEVLLDVMAARVWAWPLPAAARGALRAGFGFPAAAASAPVRATLG